MDPKAVFSQCIDEMNAATKSREYVPFAGKWFAPDGTLSLFYETHGIEKAQIVFTYIVPTGDDPTRKVAQFIYAVDGNMIHSYRRIESAELPQPVYGLQDSGFDDTGRSSTTCSSAWPAVRASRRVSRGRSH